MTLKQLNNGYKGVSVAPATGLCNLGSVFTYIKLEHAHSPPCPPKKGKKKEKRQILIFATAHHVGTICSYMGPFSTFHS